MSWMEGICDVKWCGMMTKKIWMCFCCFLKCFDFFEFWGFKMQKKTMKYVQCKNASNTPNTPTILQGLTRLYKAQLEGFLDIHKVREAQIYRWKKIMPHSHEEMVTQISTLTSQRYKVLWGLAKSDKIMLLREVSFDSPPNIYTPPEC